MMAEQGFEMLLTCPELGTADKLVLHSYSVDGTALIPSFPYNGKDGKNIYCCHMKNQFFFHASLNFTFTLKSC